MKTLTLLLAVFFLFPATAEISLAADSQHGKLLFESPDLGGGTSGKTCLTCHEHGRNFSAETLTRKTYTIMGNPAASLAEVINFCIEVALRGEAIPETGPEMNDLIAYLSVFIKNNLDQTQ